MAKLVFHPVADNERRNRERALQFASLSTLEKLERVFSLNRTCRSLTGAAALKRPGGRGYLFVKPNA